MISVIGAGPVGSFTAYQLAKASFKVSLYDKKNIIGEPVQCTGLVTPEIKKILSLNKKYILNQFKYVKINSPQESTIIKNNDYLLDRRKFDRFLFKKAQREGAQIYLNHPFKDLKKKSTLLIGADGPQSQVEKKYFSQKRNFYLGLQARIKGSFDPDTYDVYLGHVCPDFFAWLVPESDTVAKIGLVSQHNTQQLFSRLLKDKKIINKQAGLIPIFNNQKVQKNNVLLVGDAACQVKATTGGGLVPGLKASQILVNSIIHQKSYQKEIKKLNRELKTHLFIRKVLNRFTDKDYDQLIRLIDREKTKTILNQYNRDSPLKLAFKLILNQPQLLFFLRKIISP